MNFKYRYGLLLLLLVAVLASFIIFDPYGLHRSSGERSSSVHHKSLRLHSHFNIRNNSSQKSFFDSYESSRISEDSRLFSVLSPNSIGEKNRILRANIPTPEEIASKNKQIWPSGHICRMHNCFDHSICQKNGFKVFIYPTNPSDPTVSGKYKEILDSIKRSRYYTEDPEKACLFVLSLDTLDRDPLSSEYVNSLGARLEQLKLWKGGANHLVFNLYSGTWPDYSENDIGFDMGIAMLAKSSISQKHFRPGFDISFPLFHKEHSFKGGEGGYLQVTGTLAGYRQYALVFKGKRYLSGIGSETRNSLYHVNNNRDIMLLTTCKHGKDWKNLEDERCETDNKEYDKWDYKVLLKNSTFCLVPRGRRLGSYRFLEALQAGCIPVVLSNDWVLPFSEVIDWKKAVIWADERLLLQLPTIVRSVDMETILSLRQQSQFLWDTYFSSIDKIVSTTLEIVKGRLTSNDVWSSSSLVWNSSPGGLVFMQEYSQSLSRYPFYLDSLNNVWDSFSSTPSLNHLKVKMKMKFDAIIWATNASLPLHYQHSPLHKIFKTLVKCHSLRKIIVLWQLDEALLPNFKSVHMSVPVVHKKVENNGEKFLIHEDFGDGENAVSVDAVLNMDENSLLNSDEIEFGFHVWTNFQHRLVGFVARSHFWHDAKQTWHYTSKPTPDFSLILTTPAFYHRYYNHLYKKVIPPFLQQMASSCDLCHDIIMNCLISHVTKLPPIKLAQRRNAASTANQTGSLARQSLNRDNLPENSYVNEIVNVNNENNILKNRTDQVSSIYDVLNKQSNKLRPSRDGVNSSQSGGMGFTSEAEISQHHYQQKANSALIDRFMRAHHCLSAVSDYFGYMPLIKSILRFDPLLFKDPVSVVRKKYPGVDKVT